MESKEKLNYITNLLFKVLDKEELDNFDLSKEECDNIVNFNKDLRKDLNRLEKYEKVINFLKNHETHINPILSFDTLEDFKKYYSESYTKDVNEEIFNLVKEVLENGK